MQEGPAMDLDEQQRVAMMRELHDAVTHGQSGIALQTMVAEASQDPAVWRRCLSNIQRLNRESVVQLRMLDRLLRDAVETIATDSLDIPGQRAPTAVAAGWQRQFGSEGAAIKLVVPMEADQIEVTVRNTVAAVLDFSGEYLASSLPAGDLSTIVVSLDQEQIRLVFKAASSAHRWLPPLSEAAWRNLQTRTALVGGELLGSGKIFAKTRSRTIELRLKVVAAEAI